MCAIVEKRLPNRKRYGYMFLIETSEFEYITPVGKNQLHQGRLYIANQEPEHIMFKEFKPRSYVSKNSFHIMSSLKTLECIKRNKWPNVNVIVLVEIPEEAITFRGWNHRTSKNLDGKTVYLTSEMRILGHIYKQDPETKKWKKVNTKKEILSRIH